LKADLNLKQALCTLLLQLQEIAAFSIAKYQFYIQACNHKAILIFVRFLQKMHAHAFSVFTKPHETWSYRYAEWFFALDHDRRKSCILSVKTLI